MTTKIDKSKLKDSMGRPLTQSLFIEIGYETDKAMYTLKEEDFTYEKNGVTYPSLKRLYLEMEDLVEYDFANTYLLGWQHWQRMNSNVVLSKHFEEWREELEISVRSQAVRDIIQMSADEKGFQAAKWLADRGWDKRAAGRPSKQEKLKEERQKKRMEDEFSADIKRMEDYKTENR
jgi:hypothetical protein